MANHRFVMPYAKPNYELPLSDWFEDDAQEAIMAASLERDAWAAVETTLSRPSPYRQTGSAK